MILACDGLYEVMSSEDSIMWVNRRINGFSKKLMQEKQDGAQDKRSKASKTAVAHYGLDLRTINTMAEELADYAIRKGSRVTSSRHSTLQWHILTDRVFLQQDNVSVIIVFFSFGISDEEAI